MSEFECHCGGMMIKVDGRLTCEECGGHNIAYMDGLSGRQWEILEKMEAETGENGNE